MSRAKYYAGGSWDNYADMALVPSALQRTVTLAASGWSSNTQTVTVNGVTADNLIMVSPDPDDYAAYGESNIRATAQAAGSVTFVCDTTPNADIDVAVAILGTGGLPSGTADKDILLWDVASSSWFAGKPSRLPAGYQEVEYIESDGTQYIDTGVNSYRAALGLDLQFTDSTFGSNGSADSGILQITGNSADNPYLGFRNEGNTWESTITCTDRNLVVFDAYKGTIYHNGNLIHTMTGASTSGSATLYLFARLSTQWGYAYCKEKLYGAKVFSYLGTTVEKCLVRHYIPCYRISDDEIGMYDIVNDVFYTNAGTGTFIKGADV